MYALLKNIRRNTYTVCEKTSVVYSTLIREGYLEIYQGSERACEKRMELATESSPQSKDSDYWGLVL